jgi:hypothetical protein
MSPSGRPLKLTSSWPVRRKGYSPVPHALAKIAEQIRFFVTELEAGETIDPFELSMIARRIDAQAEMLAFEGKAES